LISSVNKRRFAATARRPGMSLHKLSVWPKPLHAVLSLGQHRLKSYLQIVRRHVFFTAVFTDIEGDQFARLGQLVVCDGANELQRDRRNLCLRQTFSGRSQVSEVLDDDLNTNGLDSTGDAPQYLISTESFSWPELKGMYIPEEVPSLEIFSRYSLLLRGCAALIHDNWSEVHKTLASLEAGVFHSTTSLCGSCCFAIVSRVVCTLCTNSICSCRLACAACNYSYRLCKCIVPVPLCNACSNSKVDFTEQHKVCCAGLVTGSFHHTRITTELVYRRTQLDGSDGGRKVVDLATQGSKCDCCHCSAHRHLICDTQGLEGFKSKRMRPFRETEGQATWVSPPDTSLRRGAAHSAATVIAEVFGPEHLKEKGTAQRSYCHHNARARHWVVSSAFSPMDLSSAHSVAESMPLDCRPRKIPLMSLSPVTADKGVDGGMAEANGGHSILPSVWGHHKRSQSHSEQPDAYLATTSGGSAVVEVPQQLTPIDRRNGTMLQHHQRLDRLKRRRNNGKPEERKRRVMSGGACDDTTVRNAAKAAALATLGWRKVHADYRSDYTHPSCGAVSSIQDVLRHHGFKPTSRF
jgi:hypothetical protein